MKKGALIILISLVSSGLVYSQTVEPPVENDEFGWLRWAVIVLLGIVLSGSTAFIAMSKTHYEARIADKDVQIANLTGQVVQLTKDKDELHRDMQEKVIPALTSTSEVIRTFLNNATSKK